MWFKSRVQQDPAERRMSAMNMAERLTRLSFSQTLRRKGRKGISLRRTTESPFMKVKKCKHSNIGNLEFEADELAEALSDGTDFWGLRRVYGLRQAG
jgi:hypothetical protein